MDYGTATLEMERILADAASLLSAGDIEAVLERSMVADGVGRNPGDGDYVPTYSGWLAAAEAADLLAIRALGAGGLLSFTSEGATFEWKSADFSGMAAALRAKHAGTPAGLSVISIGGTNVGAAGYGSGEGYWTWDKDVPIWYPWRSL